MRIALVFTVVLPTRYIGIPDRGMKAVSYPAEVRSELS